MTYYILLKGEPRENAMYDACILGEVTDDNKKFYPNRGFSRLQKMSQNSPELLEDVEIFNDTGKKFTIVQFLRILDTLQIQSQ